MTADSIAFPNLHITFHNVGRGITIGNFTIAFYGMVIAFGMILAYLYLMKEAERTGIKKEDMSDFFLRGIIFGIIGARAYYVIFSWEEYASDPLQIFNLRAGGLAIYGGIIAGALVVILMSRAKSISVMNMLDIVAPAVLIGQIAGRWGNFFNREVFGEYTDNLLAMQIPVSAVRDSSDITETMLEHAVTIDGIQFIQVHPTFLYESLWNLGVFLFLLWLRKRKMFNGEIFFSYIGLYGVGRFWIENMRTDQLMLAGTRIPVSQVVAIACVAAALIFTGINLGRLHREGPKDSGEDETAA